MSEMRTDAGSDAVHTMPVGSANRFWLGFLVGGAVFLLIGCVGGMVLAAAGMAANKASDAGRRVPVAVSYPADLKREGGDRGYAEVTNTGTTRIVTSPSLWITREKLRYKGESLVLEPGETKRIDFWIDAGISPVTHRQETRIKPFSSGDVIRIESEGFALFDDVVP